MALHTLLSVQPYDDWYIAHLGSEVRQNDVVTLTYGD